MKIKNVPVWLAAEEMGKGEMFVRMGLRLNRFPFGVAVQGKGGRWSYQISPKRFCQYQGCTMTELITRKNRREGVVL